MKNNKCPVCSRRFDASDTKKRNSGSALRHNMNNTGNLLRSSGTGRQVLDENARIQKEDLLARHPARRIWQPQRQRRRQQRAAAEAENSGESSCGGRGVSCAAYNDEILNQTGSGIRLRFRYVANQSR
jgi:hypothetical protein